MHLTYRGINEAFRGLVQGIHNGSIPTTPSPSRYGDVLVITEPLIVTYSDPKHRVLFNQARDANCFFHLVEVLWLLAGRNDVESLDYYNSRMKEFSDNGVTFHGAYGHRWRTHFGHDQLAIVIDSLRKDKHSRRVVLAMWDPKVDGQGNGKDYPCNTHCYFLYNPATQCLDLTVCNRSNDTVWGLLGANIVQMSCLLEYVSLCVGLPMGVLNQATNNAHVYVNNFEPEKWLADTTPNEYLVDKVENIRVVDGKWNDESAVHHVPLVKDSVTFDEECQQFITMRQEAPLHNWTEPFLQTVAAPMCWAFSRHKQRLYKEALDAASLIMADDWRIASVNWLLKRKALWEAKQSASIQEHGHV